MIGVWLAGLVRVRTAIVLGTVSGIAIAVGLIVSLGVFMQSSAAEMTARAASDVPIDWQVEVAPGASIDSVIGEMQGAARIARTAIVGYAASDGFEASGGGTVQVTGPGKVLGIEGAYVADFPGNIRPLLGKLDGVLIAQQTAANLHVAPGDAVTIHRPGLPDIGVTVAGVVELPNADSMFQAVGAPAGAQPQAPPDNVLILPLGEWHTLFDPQADVRPDSVRMQVHAKLDRVNLADDPQAAFTAIVGQGHNFEARAAGSALLANNLAAILDTAREDALYARVLFLFLGAPGVAIAILLTMAVARSATAHRRRDQSLLRLRGASPSFLLKVAGIEALMVGIGGSALGLVLGAVVSRALLAASPISSRTIVWFAAAALIGIALSLVAILVPAWRDARHLTIVSARSSIDHARHPLWLAAYLDVVCLALAMLIFWKTAASGYQIVLAPEGVAAISVDYWAFLSPLFFWLGMGLLGLRLTGIFLSSARRTVNSVLRPVAGRMAPLVAAALSRQTGRISAGVALVGLAIAFATSTAIFNATYQAQSLVDAELTNGADVTVTGTSAAPAGQAIDRLAAIPGAIAVAPMQHRFAYVGTDLQDLYGIDPSAIGRATTMSNAYFGNGDAQASLAALQNTPDGVLVSDETVTDFQLEPGDTINLRLQSAVDHQYHVVPFRFIGIVREFPTAPSDSFLVTNADYVARMTGSTAAEVVLIRVAGDPRAVREQAVRTMKDVPGVQIHDITEARRLIGSSLTAINLKGLTQLELSYAVVLSACAAGLALALGVLDRRRSFAIMVALGAKRTHLLAFLRSEAFLIMIAGSILGYLAGVVVAWLLVRLLTGVFDPPPDRLMLPWLYLWVLFAATFASAAIAVVFAERRVEVSPIQILREAL
jgi:putative ABC transport system permease protein